jgi:hypothetical protein
LKAITGKGKTRRAKILIGWRSIGINYGRNLTNINNALLATGSPLKPKSLKKGTKRSLIL